MDVREATPGDAEAVREVAAVTWHAAHDPIVGADAVDDFLADHYDPSDLRERFENGDSVTYVAETDGEVVGFATGVPGDDAYTLAAIYVHPDHQGAGVGTKLLDCIEAAARGSPHDAIRLVVMAENEDSIAFYESRGFVRVDDHYDENLEVDGYVYEKPVAA